MARGKLFEGLLRSAGQVATPAVTSGALTTGYSLLTGGSPGEALLFGLGDAVASGGSLAALRALRPGSYAKKQVRNLKTGKVETIGGSSRAEMPVNFLTSVGVGYGLSSLLGGGAPSTDYIQSQQILQQNVQRDILNGVLAGKYANPNSYSPETMFQTQGIEGTLLREQADEILNPRTSFNINSLMAEMGGIAGV